MKKKTWRCFFCDEVFRSRRAAWEHFGEENCTSDVPACIDPLRSDEKARMKELREAREHAMKAQRDMEEMDNDVGLLRYFETEIGRLFGVVGGVKASTPHQAWLVLDAAQGEILALKERNAALDALLNTPELVDDEKGPKTNT
jgi:hypothetical protein